mmetsp:Transcript_84311/g.217116  ORF Transcript_84311/g.217116 Transcript_84311/m.217116 type:complete len:239 (+) Transcript_84311:1298-2014(+)
MHNVVREQLQDVAIDGATVDCSSIRPGGATPNQRVPRLAPRKGLPIKLGLRAQVAYPDGGFRLFDHLNIAASLGVQRWEPCHRSRRLLPAHKPLRHVEEHWRGTNLDVCFRLHRGVERLHCCAEANGARDVVDPVLRLSDLLLHLAAEQRGEETRAGRPQLALDGLGLSLERLQRWHHQWRVEAVRNVQLARGCANLSCHLLHFGRAAADHHHLGAIHGSNGDLLGLGLLKRGRHIRL